MDDASLVRRPEHAASAAGVRYQAADPSGVREARLRSATEGDSDTAAKSLRSVHDYLGVDEDIVWQVVTEDLTKLVEALEPFVPPAP